MTQGKIRRHDAKLNAIARLADSAIILITFLALMDIFAIEWQQKHVWSLLLSIVLFNFFAESLDTYRSWRGTAIRHEVYAILFAWLTAILILVIAELLILNEQTYAKPFVAIWIIVTPIEIISWHMIVRTALGMMRSKGMNTRRVGIIGATSLGHMLESAFREMDWSGYRFTGFYDDRKPAPDRRLSDDQAEVVGNIDQLIRDCKDGKVDVVFITLSLAAEARIKQVTEELADTTASVYLVPDLFTFNLLNSRWVEYQGITAISIYETPFAGVDSFIKRLEDIVLSFMILLLIAVPMIFIAACIKTTSKGPVFFKQTRYGMDGEKIRVWKFRTMYVEEDGPKVIQATKNDPRVTPFGGFLRRTSLDELPQFFNSLGGSMSIVGPRPHAVAHNEEYRSKIHGYMLRHKVKPGITGLAQINGYRGETDTLDKMEGRVKYDLQYIQNWSLMLDLKVIMLTILRGFSGKNVY